MGILKKTWSLLFFLAICTPVTGATEVPMVNAGIGSCSVEFTVEDSAHKPQYDAKIGVTVQYGFLGLHKTELEVGTDGNGKARFEGLPSKVKKPLQFRVRRGQQSKTVEHDPAVRCHANYTVVLGTQ